ncbi:NAD(P)H nitroreductase [Rhizocola hellebori]|uniref:NAD(P)H nitroreductase n=1 Tax=Rhizocola hellebori TaxID=1392758 RepID=A0A8J3VF57_9ACTN|nr:nitroreductase [Rhizocola hellebori]GIH03598.1 NAD(P)H nitroreductase [Rhizocola hellebori]
MATYLPSRINGAVPELRAMNEALLQAAQTAGYAPSIRNTRPWRWRLTGSTLDLHLDRSRVVTISDPDARLATLSCGAALHHARVALAASGWKVKVLQTSDHSDPDHLVQLRIARGTTDSFAVQRMQAILVRRTDRRPVTGAPVAPADLAAITKSVEAQGAWLYLLHPDQRHELSAAAEYARRTQLPDSPWRDELAYWAGGRPERTGVADSAIASPMPGRNFGNYGSPKVSAEDDQTATFVMLYGPGDTSADWLRAGEGLSAGWLTATELGITVLPLSATIEVPATREVMKRLVAGVGHPYLVLRLGTIDSADSTPPSTPRLPTDQIIDRT